jgi:hypothetical protein
VFKLFLEALGGVLSAISQTTPLPETRQVTYPAKAKTSQGCFSSPQDLMEGCKR